MLLNISTVFAYYRMTALCVQNTESKSQSKGGYTGGEVVDSVSFNLQLILSDCLNISVGRKWSQYWEAVDPDRINNTAI